MTNSAEKLVTALRDRNAELFAKQCIKIKESEIQAQETAESLLDVARREDSGSAAYAVNALRFSGLILQEDTYQKLIRIAEGRYPSSALAELAKQEKAREQQKSGRNSLQMRLLVTILMAILRKKKGKTVPFVKLVRQHFVGTQLLSRTEKWQSTDTDGEEN